MAASTKRVFKPISASELLGSQWIMSVEATPISKSTRETPSYSTKSSDVTVRLSFKDLLNVSSDWKANNYLKGETTGPLNHDFQIKQIDRIVEAIGLTLPHGQVNKSFLVGGNTQSTANLDYQQNASGRVQVNAQFYDDFLTKELAYDLGVDVQLLRHQLRALFSHK